MSWTADAPSTEEVLAAILASPLPALPPQEQRLGASTVSWWEMGPGEVYIHAEGGSADDRHYGSTLVGLALAPHGYRRAQFDLDQDVIHPGSRRIASWVDLMAKAKRLIQSGQVHMLRNGFNYIVGHVVGDHGEYDTEISRDDPDSRAITGWQCSCPWDQYAWQRTRKWKKFEGRPCAHVLALYWKALSTPMDEQLSPEQAEAMGTGQALHAPAVEEHAPGREPGTPHADKQMDKLPRSFGPEGDILQGDQMAMNVPPDALGGPPGPAQAPMAPPPGGPQPPGILPEFPGAPPPAPWAGPGTTPGGGVSPPEAISVPGAKPQSPFNPLQNPGTYSKIADASPWYHGTLADRAETIRTQGFSPDEDLWLTSSPEEADKYGTRHQMDGVGAVVPATLHHTNPFVIDRTQPEPYSSGFSPMLKQQLQGAGVSPPDRYDWATELRHKGYDAIEYHYPDRKDIQLWDPSLARVSKTSDFNAPEPVRAKKPLMGLAEGPVPGQYGDGEYREVPAGTPGEVRHQDATTGWIECAFDLNNSGENEPYRITVFVEPGDIESAGDLTPSDPAIRRHTKTASEGWTPGSWGKGNIQDDHVTHWNTDAELGAPHHIDRAGGDLTSVKRFDISPEGKVSPIVDGLDQRWTDGDWVAALSSHPQFASDDDRPQGYGHAPNLASAVPGLDSEWQGGNCDSYAMALLAERPELRLGGTGNADFGIHHWFAHDDTHAYDSLGSHPLPYHGVSNQFDTQWLDQDPEDYGLPENGGPDDVARAREEIRRTAKVASDQYSGPRPEIDQQFYLDQPDGTRLGPYLVVDDGESEYGPYVVVRMDAEGNDASQHLGEQGVDWEYVTIDLNQLMGQTIVPA